jgi:hypothetical protein
MDEEIDVTPPLVSFSHKLPPTPPPTPVTPEEYTSSISPPSPMNLPPPAIALPQPMSCQKRQYVRIFCDEPIKIQNKGIFSIIWLDENSFYLIPTENRPF